MTMKDLGSYLKRWILSFMIPLTLLASGCATTSITNRGERNEIDPFEVYNRTVFVFNDAADRLVIKPVAEIYDRYTPELFRFLIGNFLKNLGEVNNSVNNLLQGKPKAALGDATRFLLNLTLGFGGLGDPATELGLERSNEDFGQTLGKWGVPAGPYIVLPLLGPSSVRDLANFPVGTALDPMTKLGKARGKTAVSAAQLIETRASLLSATNIMDRVALDPYVFTRNFYFQRRLSLIYDGDPPFHKPPPEDEEPPKQ